MYKVLSQSDDQTVRNVDIGLKNKFTWSWLEREVEVEDQSKNKSTVKLREFIKKVDVPGKALCTLCNCLIYYGSKGGSSLNAHCASQKHIKNISVARSNYTVKYMFGNPERYETQHAPVDESSRQQTTAPKVVAMCDRVSNAEALLLGVMSEHSMPFTYAPVLVDLAKALAADPKALSQLSMDRSTASYKTTHGLAEGFMEKLIIKLKSQPFSLNIDESTAHNNKHVLTMLVSYFSGDTVVCEHLKSVELTKVDSQTIYDNIVWVMEKNDIPWTNLISILMDSCNVMRGKKSGVETRIRQEKAPHLLDIDGDSCHHLHNCCKKFCRPFDRYLENLFCDLYSDFKWSSDLCEYIGEICALLGIKFTKPERFISHRWLAAYDLAISTEILLDAYTVFYYAFLKTEDRTVFLSKILDIYKKRNVTPNGRDRIREIREQLAKKKMTDEGKGRKLRITKKLFDSEQTTLMQLALYQEVLPILKSYVMTFQSNDVLVHQLHDKQLETFKNFLVCFVKAEQVVNKSAKQLLNLNLKEDEGQFMKLKDMFVGGKVKKIIRESDNKDINVNKFLETAAAAYLECALHMQEKLPLNSKTLRAFSCVDPKIRNHTEGMKGLEELVRLCSFLLSEDEEDQVHKEIRQYSVESSIQCDSDDVMQWWNAVQKTNKYPSLCKVVIAALSVFHGPMVESSFNVMGDVIGPKSARLNVETYSSIQTIKYGLRSRKTTAIKLFRRKHPVTDPVDRHICRKLRSAAGKFKAKQLKTKQEKENRLKMFGISGKPLPKGEVKTALIARHENNYNDHIDLETQRARKRLMKARLEKLCAKRQKQI